MFLAEGAKSAPAPRRRTYPGQRRNVGESDRATPATADSEPGTRVVGSHPGTTPVDHPWPGCRRTNRGRTATVTAADSRRPRRLPRPMTRPRSTSADFPRRPPLRRDGSEGRGNRRPPAAERPSATPGPARHRSNRASPAARPRLAIPSAFRIPPLPPGGVILRPIPGLAPNSPLRASGTSTSAPRKSHPNGHPVRHRLAPLRGGEAHGRLQSTEGHPNFRAVLPGHPRAGDGLPVVESNIRGRHGGTLGNWRSHSITRSVPRLGRTILPVDPGNPGRIPTESRHRVPRPPQDRERGSAGLANCILIISKAEWPWSGSAPATEP